MATVKINNKSYTVPQLGFGHLEALESEGYSVVDMFRKKQAFAPASAFIMLCVECDREQANVLAEQHVLGGGNIVDLANAFQKALTESAFFRKLLGIEEDEKKGAKKSVTPEMEQQ